jgi:tetratricopeptide (TPR) repeat protein
VDSVAPRILISHADKDRAWAEWARWHLEAAGHATDLAGFEWSPGTNRVEAMDRALRRDNPMLVLLSSAYLDHTRPTTDEWTTRFAQHRTDQDAKLIPLRIEDIDLRGGLWAPIVVSDLFDLPAGEAVTVLLEAVRRALKQPSHEEPSVAPPDYPGRRSASAPPEAGPRPPGSLPAAWNLARRNTDFTGRDGMLNRLHDTLQRGSRVAVQALHGLGGVGKTQLALEYAHRFAGEYDVVWWVPSEQSELISDHLSALAQKLRLIPAGTANPEAVEALREHLRRTRRWLLVFDNAEDRDELAPWLPDGAGHLLITSRNHHWAGVARPVDVDVFSRTESIALIHTHLQHLNDTDADRLADALGDLPLAVGQAVDLLAETMLSVETYLRELAAHAAELMSKGRSPGGYPLSLAAAVTLTARRLCTASPAAGQLLYLCARMGSEPIPVDLFTDRPDLLPEPLREVATDTVAFAGLVARLSRYGLARLSDAGPTLHRLIQAVLRDVDSAATANRDTVERILVAADPEDGDDPQSWPRWSALLPHILAVDPATTENAGVRSMAGNAMWHLKARGDARAALPMTERLHNAWSRRYGYSDRATLDIVHVLANIYRDLGNFKMAHVLSRDNFDHRMRLVGPQDTGLFDSALSLARSLEHMGKYEEARELDEEALAGYSQNLGDDHPHTLTAATCLAGDLRRLGAFMKARQLDADTLARQRRILGEDHPSTLMTAQNFVIDLHETGDFEQAHELNRDTLARRRRVLGENHPDTLVSAHNLAVGLHREGQYEQSRTLNEDTLARRREALGDGHPSTLSSVNNLASDLDALGRPLDADRLRQEFSRHWIT